MLNDEETHPISLHLAFIHTLYEKCITKNIQIRIERWMDG